MSEALRKVKSAKYEHLAVASARVLEESLDNVEEFPRGARRDAKYAPRHGGAKIEGQWRRDLSPTPPQAYTGSPAKVVQG